MIYAIMAIWTIGMIGVAVAMRASLRDLRQQRALMPTREIEHGEALFFENGMLINSSPEVKTIFSDLDIPVYERGLMWLIWALLGDEAQIPTEDGKYEYEGAFDTNVYITRKQHELSLHILCASGPAHIALRLAICDFLTTAYRGLCESSPTAMSATQLSGARVLENSSYVQLAERYELEQMVDVPGEIESGDAIAVQTSTAQGPNQRHFDVHISRVENLLHFDIRDSSDRHSVHQNVQTFRRTMTQTFADLSVGLGVFDKDQHLITFNPALLELLQLPVTFLSQRPSMFSFFAKLRETGVMPEPDNFAQWQEGLLEMVDASSDGLFNEVWYGLEGRALRVMGRPHPSGGFSFLVEDISQNIALQKTSKAQLRAHQFMIDKIAIPMAAFDSEGIMIVKNDAFESLTDQHSNDEERTQTFSAIMRLLSKAAHVHTAHTPDNGTLIWIEEPPVDTHNGSKKKSDELMEA